MRTEKRRLFNNRPVCFAALALAAGIILCECLYGTDRLFRLVPIAVATAVAVALFIPARTRRFGYLAVAFLVGVVSMAAASDVFDSRLAAPSEGRFTARVAGEIVSEDGTLSFYVDRVYDGEGNSVYGEGRVYLDGFSAPDFGMGDLIELEGDLRPEEHLPFDTYFSSAALKGEYFVIFADDAGFLAEGDADFLSRIRASVKEVFYRNTDPDTAAICTALVLGDKRGVDDSLYEAVQASGLAHILAVSGLHVTALAGAVMWLLRKCRLDGRISFVAVLALTFVYVALCSFTPSAVRAFVMTAALNFGTAFGLKRDLLSSLALAAFVIMLFSPFSVMHVGFLLSVFAVLGIFLFAGALERLLERGVNTICPSVFASVKSFAAATGVPTESVTFDISEARRKGRAEIYSETKGQRITVKDGVARRVLVRLSQAVSVSVAANLTTLPLAALFFGKVQTLFILANIVILPYMMIIYTILLVITPFALITGLSGLVGIFDFLLLPFTAFVRAVGSVSFASLSVGTSVAAVATAEIFLVLCSPFVFLTRRRRAVALCCVAAVGAAVCAVFSAVAA